MPSGSYELELALDRVPGAQSMSLVDVHEYLWQWIEQLVHETCGRHEIDSDLWRFYQEGGGGVEHLFAEDVSPTRSVMIFRFTHAYSRSASARLARHWATLAVLARDTHVVEHLAQGGWRIVDPMPLATALVESAEGITYCEGSWVFVEPLSAHDTLAQLARQKALFSIDHEFTNMPKLGELSRSERDAVEWVAMTGLCQCRLCVRLGTRCESYIDPVQHIDLARWTWELLETDPRAHELEQVARDVSHDWIVQPAGPPELHVLEDYLEQRGVRPPRAALRGMLLKATSRLEEMGQRDCYSPPFPAPLPHQPHR